MEQLTKQDIGLLMEAMERWESMPDIAFILSVANGTPAEAASRMQQELANRKERSVVLRAKLIKVRDSIVASDFVESSLKSS